MNATTAMAGMTATAQNKDRAERATGRRIGVIPSEGERVDNDCRPFHSMRFPCQNQGPAIGFFELTPRTA
jgi:hypothetical protein